MKKVTKSSVMKYSVYMAAAVVMLLAACKKESSEKRIEWLRFSHVQNGFQLIEDLVVIDETSKTISFATPDEWDVKTLYLDYRLSEGATASLKRNESYDFSRPVPFTITAENGSTITYTITVTKIETKMLSLAFKELGPSVSVTFKENVKKENWYSDVDVTIPFYIEADFTQLTPVVTLSQGCKLYYAKYNLQTNVQEYLPVNDLSFDFTQRSPRLAYMFYVIADVAKGRQSFYNRSYSVELFISHMDIEHVSKTSISPGEQLTLNGYFAPSGNTVLLKRQQNTWDMTMLGQSESAITAKIPASLPVGQYTLSVASHGETVDYTTPITVSIPIGQPWITGLDKEIYHKGESLVITGNNFPTGDIAYINFVPVLGGVTIVRNIQTSGDTATLDAIPDELQSGVDYEISIHFSDSNQWTNDYPITISD